MIDTHKLVVVGLEEEPEAITYSKQIVYTNLGTKAEIEALRVETKADIQMLKSDINSIKWMMGLGFSIMIALMSIIIALKLLV